ncbi:MAG TPA: DUF4397 domain-containing protein [Ruminiclostridium sp.]
MMNDNSFYTDQMDLSRQMPGMAYIRLFHAAPNTPAVDVYADGKLIAKRLTYGQFTEYMPLAMGTYSIEAFPFGLKQSPILSIRLPIADSKMYTLAIIGLLPRIGILPIEDEYEDLYAGRVNIRFANLSPNAPSLNLALSGGLDLFTDIKYTELSDYRSMIPGIYNFVVRPTMTATNVAHLPNIRLLPKRNLTFYVLGIFGQQPSTLEVFIPMDGTSYLRV